MPFIEAPSNFYIGRYYDPQSAHITDEVVYYESRDLTTHAVVVGMTGSGKTGLCITLLEEAILDGIPAIIIDPKGDITNLMLAFSDLRPESFLPWINYEDAARSGLSPQEYAQDIAQRWREGLDSWGIGSQRIEAYRSAATFNIYTPGSDAGLPISILAQMRAPREGWVGHEEYHREHIRALVTAILSMIGMTKVNPVKDREHVLISNIFEYSWRNGVDITLQDIILQVQRPPFDKLGVFDIETLFPEKDRFKLAMELNNIIAAPSFQSWLQGEPLDFQQMLYTQTPQGPKPKVNIFYIAHLSENQRSFMITLILESILAGMRQLRGTSSLRSLFYFDEVFGHLPPHPKNPPTKEPLLRLLKQGRAFGIGTILATQNPGDLDYKGLTNAGTWFIGRLQTENDKKRVLDGLTTASSVNNPLDIGTLDALISSVQPRMFVMNNVHDPRGPRLIHSRWAMSFLSGPLTREQIRMVTQTELQRRQALGMGNVPYGQAQQQVQQQGYQQGYQPPYPSQQQGYPQQGVGYQQQPYQQPPAQQAGYQQPPQFMGYGQPAVQAPQPQFAPPPSPSQYQPPAAPYQAAPPPPSLPEVPTGGFGSAPPPPPSSLPESIPTPSQYQPPAAPYAGDSGFSNAYAPPPAPYALPQQQQPQPSANPYGNAPSYMPPSSLPQYGGTGYTPPPATPSIPAWQQSGSPAEVSGFNQGIVPSGGASNLPQQQASATPNRRLPEGYSPTQPVLSSSLEQYFLPILITPSQALDRYARQSNRRVGRVDEYQLLYSPFLLAQVQIRYLDRNTGINTVETYAYHIFNMERAGLIHWDQHVAPPVLTTAISHAPLEENAAFGEVSASLADRTRHTTLKKEILDYVYKTAGISLVRNPQLKIHSVPGMTFYDFQAQVVAAAREGRDQEIASLTAKFERDFERLEEKYRREERELRADEKEFRDLGREELVTMGEAALSLLKGRTAYTLSRVSRTRRYKGQAQESIVESNEVLREIEIEMNELQDRYERELQNVSQKWNQIANKIEEFRITPFKKDIHTELFGVGWLPEHLLIVGGEMIRLPAWNGNPNWQGEYGQQSPQAYGAGQALPGGPSGQSPNTVAYSGGGGGYAQPQAGAYLPPRTAGSQPNPAYNPRPYEDNYGQYSGQDYRGQERPYDDGYYRENPGY